MIVFLLEGTYLSITNLTTTSALRFCVMDIDRWPLKTV